MFNGAEAGMEIVSVVVPAPVSRDTELGFSAMVTFVMLDESVVFRFTLPAKLLRLVSETVNDARPPCGAVMLAGLVAIVKSGDVDCPIPATPLSIVEA